MEQFDDEDDLAATCLLSLIEAAREHKGNARRHGTGHSSRTRRSEQARCAAVAAPLSAPAALMCGGRMEAGSGVFAGEDREEAMLAHRHQVHTLSPDVPAT